MTGGAAGGKRGASAAEQLSSSSPGGGDEDLLDLACGETIPGSPVHPSSDPAARHDNLQAGSATAALPASKSKSTSSSVSYLS